MIVSGGLRSRSPEHGFTVVELVVVISITAILAAVAIPRFYDQQTFQERGFYDEALSAARYAQKFAVATGCEVQLSVAAGVYTLNQRNPSCATPPFDPFTRLVVHPGGRDPNVPFTGTTPSGVLFTMTPSPVVFDALGRATDATVTVGSRTFQIVGATGFVQAP